MYVTTRPQPNRLNRRPTKQTLVRLQMVPGRVAQTAVMTWMILLMITRRTYLHSLRNGVLRKCHVHNKLITTSVRYIVQNKPMTDGRLTPSLAALAPTPSHIYMTGIVCSLAKMVYCIVITSQTMVWRRTNRSFCHSTIGCKCVASSTMHSRLRTWADVKPLLS